MHKCTPDIQEQLSELIEPRLVFKEFFYSVLEAWSLEKSKLPTQLEFPRRWDGSETSGDRISVSMEALQSSERPVLKHYLDILKDIKSIS